MSDSITDVLLAVPALILELSLLSTFVLVYTSHLSQSLSLHFLVFPSPLTAHRNFPQLDCLAL